MESTHEELKSLIPAYVLGAVPAEEVPAIRSHILSCEECLAEAESFTDATSALALAADPVAVPDGFQSRVMAKVRQETPQPARGAKRRWSLAPLLYASAVVLVVAVLGLALADARNETARQRELIAALLRGEADVKLSGEGEVVGKLVSTDGSSVFVANGLQGAPSEHTYQLWLLKGSCEPGGGGACDVISAGTFQAEDGMALLKTARSLEGIDGAAVTIEPGDGSPEPTGSRVMDSA